jgi:hypothetical protein
VVRNPRGLEHLDHAQVVVDVTGDEMAPDLARRAQLSTIL